jgi:hypothetical protein
LIGFFPAYAKDRRSMPKAQIHAPSGAAMNATGKFLKGLNKTGTPQSRQADRQQGEK